MIPAPRSTPSPALPDANVADLVIRQARATPDAVAIVDRAGPTTYAALAARAGAIEQLLRQRHVAPEQPIGVLMPRTASLIAVLLAVMRAGAAYVPLDPDDPAERNRRIVAQSGCHLILGDRTAHEALRATLASTTPAAALDFVDVGRIEPGDPGREFPPSAPGGRRLAYLLFTSGSTGAPKGVEIEHASVVNLLFAARDLLGFTAADRYLAASTIGFDISVAEIFLPLITGGSLLLRDRSIWLDPRALADDLRTQGVTVLQMGPSVWSVVLAEVAPFPPVRVAISTGEPVPPPLARRIAAVGTQAWNLYGPTETTVWSTAHRLTTAADASPQAISAPIGRPLANTTVTIVDETGRPVGPGERGELCLGGAGVARGYRHQPALTAERFVVLGPDGERHYRTGDVVAWNAHGELEYFGRNDDQLKIRGVRIEPREVEAAILEHPAVAQTAATWFEGAGSRSIVAGVVRRAGAEVTVAALHTWLGTRLPAAMVPSRLVFLPALPLAPSGKVDRGAIRARVTAAPVEEDETDEAPDGLNATERVIADIWQRLLKVPAVGVDDHFLAIGGDSLAAVKMISEVETLFKISLPVQTVFEAPTLRRLAARVERANEQSPESYESNYLFPLVEVPGSRPLFFSNVDLRLAIRGTWKAPCTLYSISHWAQGSGFIKAKSVGDLARQHVARIRKVQPEGPYRLAGFSFGGLVALEMARQLRQDGERVDFLLLLDPMLPYRKPSAPSGYAMEGQVTPLDESWGGRLVRHARAMRREPGRIAHYVW
ncbi:MAG: amino acid adenylation domain-containing protein, partial [Opitutaceae bacterium]|nr:amino acid adenylation domain-containing protein [Opitutaceae bacterium]